MVKKIVDKRIKLIIDTDIGTDIDDLFVLYFALSNPNVDLIGVITSYQNSPLRSMQAKHVLKLFSRQDIPVFVGCGEPIRSLHNVDLNLKICQYTDELGLPENYDYSGNTAIDFLIGKARELKDELVILEIAPETTLARAILKDKDAFKNTHIQIMGGEFYTHRFEWNIECDVEAAKIVSTSGLNLTYVGLDVCNVTEYKDDEMINLLFKEYNDPLLSYLSKCINLWQKTEKRGVILYDLIAFLTIFEPNLCSFEECLINFEEKDNHAYIYLSKEGYLAKIAKSINKKILDDYVKSLFTGGVKYEKD